MPTTAVLPTASLRVFVPPAASQPDEPPGLSADCTLRQLFEQAFVPLWILPRGLDMETRRGYEQALAYWERLTGNPTLRQLDDNDLLAAEFSAALQQVRRRGQAISLRTAQKHATCLNKLLAFAGPRAPDKRGAKNRELIERPPRIDTPAPDENPDVGGDLTVEEVHALYLAAEQMLAPVVPGVPPADWWRALLVVLWQTGLRIGAAMRLAYADLGDDGYLLVRASGSKRRRGKRQYLPRESREAIERVRTERRLIFEFPPSYASNRRQLHALLEKLFRRAGIAKRRGVAFHGFRKGHATSLAGVEDASWIANAQASLGHGSAATTLRHYIASRATERKLEQVIEQLPSPKPREDGRQRLLPLSFD